MSNTFAKVETTMIPVVPVYHRSDGTHWLHISVPNGWDDVRKICKRVLSCEGRVYTFIGWNSDVLECYFKEASTNVATFVKR